MFFFEVIYKVMKKNLLFVLIAIAAAVAAGINTTPESEWLGIPLLGVYSLIGQLFLNALYLVMVPLVAASIITGTAKLGSEHAFGKLGLKTFTLFLSTTAIALIIGWTLAVFFKPGASSLVPQGLESIEMGAGFDKVQQVLFRLIPSNILAAASEGQMMGVIVFCLLFGYFLSQLGSRFKEVLIPFWEGIFQIMMKITHLVMKVLPFGVFGLVAKAVSTTGKEAIWGVGFFFLVVLLGLFLYGFVALNAILKFGWKINPIAHLKAMAPALFTAFSTSSSAATLPVLIQCIEEKSKVPNKIASFALPLGASINLAGSSLQVIISVFFIAQSYGISLPFTSQLLVFFMGWILSLGVAGIPSASLISIVIILTTLGLPAEGVGLVMAVERILDMCRTAVNTYSNSCCCVILARSESEIISA